MSIKRVVSLTTLGVLMVTLQAWAQPDSVVVEALMGNTAVLMIDGQRKMLREGQTFSGVTLITVDPKTATLEFGGKTQTVGLSQRVHSNYQQLEEKVVTIGRDARMQYQTTALINGRSVLVLVDTGANVVAISSAQADTMGIDYFEDGTPSQIETASGMTQAHSITLQSVSVGGIKVENVRASVVEGAFPVTILLGMSYLQHVKMQEHNGILSLTKSP